MEANQYPTELRERESQLQSCLGVVGWGRRQESCLETAGGPSSSSPRLPKRVQRWSTARFRESTHSPMDHGRYRRCLRVGRTLRYLVIPTLICPTRGSVSVQRLQSRQDKAFRSWHAAGGHRSCGNGTIMIIQWMTQGQRQRSSFRS